jgi:exonuclease III
MIFVRRNLHGYTAVYAATSAVVRFVGGCTIFPEECSMGARGASLVTMVGLLVATGLVVGHRPSAQTGGGTVKLAYFNIQGGKGEMGLPGRPILFTDNANCTDKTAPLNAWGVGFVQQALAPVRNDPSVVALGLSESWLCGSAENVRLALGWARKTTQGGNGVAIIARHGFAGPESWQQLDTSLNPNPADTMWVGRVPICVDAACSASILMYTAHWLADGPELGTTFTRQAEQTIEFMTTTAAGEAHVLLGDLNVWEDPPHCSQPTTPFGLPLLRQAGYLDAWRYIHGSAEGFTGMTNRRYCGTPEGYPFKRIDYAWSTPDLPPLHITRFAVPAVIGDAAASDHFGLIATYPLSTSDDTTPPVVTLTTPANGATLSGSVTMTATATDNVAVTRVELFINGVRRHTLSAAPYSAVWDTRADANGTSVLQARAFDAAGNSALSPSRNVTIANAASPPPTAGDIVVHARRATTLAGGWRVIQDATAAGGAAVAHPNAGAPKLAEALAAPTHYFDVSVRPLAGQPYRLWIRGRAEGNIWSNDSVFVQFSGSLTSTGAPAFRIGTTASTIINLEDAIHAGVSGWGWQDNGYGAGVLGPPIYFDGSTQRLRIQSREDGMVVDQIVLSPATYMNAAPGSLVQDRTILAETSPPTTHPEIVLRASAASRRSGAWRPVTDASAAGGVAVTHPDAGAAKRITPLAAPTDYVELTFNADAGRTYRLWIRGRADRDSWANDSVFVQFSGSIAADGTPIDRIGTAQAATINLEDGVNVGVAGWGWQDTGYGVGVLGPVIRFAASGVQTIRIQTREDGLRIDQIVLSSGTYLTRAPGALKNDTTILP